VFGAHVEHNGAQYPVPDGDLFMRIHFYLQVASRCDTDNIEQIHLPDCCTHKTEYNTDEVDVDGNMKTVWACGCSAGFEDGKAPLALPGDAYTSSEDQRSPSISGSPNLSILEEKFLLEAVGVPESDDDEEGAGGEAGMPGSDDDEEGVCVCVCVCVCMCVYVYLCADCRL
jgi:hypothetical protein